MTSEVDVGECGGGGGFTERYNSKGCSQIVRMFGWMLKPQAKVILHSITTCCSAYFA